MRLYDSGNAKTPQIARMPKTKLQPMSPTKLQPRSLHPNASAALAGINAGKNKPLVGSRGDRSGMKSGKTKPASFIINMEKKKYRTSEKSK